MSVCVCLCVHIPNNSVVTQGEKKLTSHVKVTPTWICKTIILIWHAACLMLCSTPHYTHSVYQLTFYLMPDNKNQLCYEVMVFTTEWNESLFHLIMVHWPSTAAPAHCVCFVTTKSINSSSSISMGWTHSVPLTGQIKGHFRKQWLCVSFEQIRHNRCLFRLPKFSTFLTLYHIIVVSASMFFVLEYNHLDVTYGLWKHFTSHQYSASRFVVVRIKG